MSPSSLFEIVAARFDEVQNTAANHRKNCVALYKTQLQAAKEEAGERAFIKVFMDMIRRILVIKKGTFVDRTSKFVGAYVKHVNDKALEESQKTSVVEEDTIASRFISALLQWLLQGFLAKAKIVRLRSVHIVSEMIAHIGEIDNETYEMLKDQLIDRICDKEHLIRVYANIALSKLIGTEDADELEKGEKTILDILLESCCFDPAPEVRRAVLVNLPVTQETLVIILARTRDTDAVTRKLVYTSALQVKLGHPRLLTISQREEVIKTGLGDREPGVRAAVAKLIGAWFEIAIVDAPQIAEHISWEGDDGGVMKGLIHLLGFFDVVGAGETVAADTVLSLFTTKPGLMNSIIFTGNYWKELTPERAVLARVFLDHCVNTQNIIAIEAASLPVVTEFAFCIQEMYNFLLGLLQDVDLLGVDEESDEESEGREEEIAKKEIILVSLLRMAARLDYTDELGRRKVFAVVKDMLAHPHLPPSLIDPCLDVMTEITPSERELIRVVVEIIIDLRDDENNEIDDTADVLAGLDANASTQHERSMRRARQPSHMTDEEQREADVTDMRCLTICIAMLTRVHGSFEDNSTLEGMLSDLIIPAVKRKELALREKGIVGLGLCCLIAKSMAINSFQLFLSQVQAAPDELKAKVLQIIMDLLIMYDLDFLRRDPEVADQIITFLLQTLENEESDSAQSVIVMGLSKLLLSNIITDTKVLASLALAYISPSTNENIELRQCLSYFFPAYCYSSLDHQERVRSIFMDVFDLTTRLRGQLDSEDESLEMVTSYQFGLQMIDWTDPEKAVYKLHRKNVHAMLAVDILLALYDSDRSDDERKTLCQLLCQLHILPEFDDDIAIVKICVLIDHLDAQCPFNSPSIDTVFGRFHAKFMKTFETVLHTFDVGKFRLEEDEDGIKIRELCEAISVDVPDALGTRTVKVSKIRRRTKRDGEWVNVSRDEEGDTVEMSRDEDEESTLSLSRDEDTNDDEDGGEEERDDNRESQISVTPMKPGVKRGAMTPKQASKKTRRKRNSDTDDEDTEVPTTPTRKTKSKSVRRGVRMPAIRRTRKQSEVSSDDEEQ